MHRRRVVTLTAHTLLGSADKAVPVSWVALFHDRAKSKIPAAELANARVFGMQDVFVTYDHEMTAEDILLDRVETLERRLREIREGLPAHGVAPSTAWLERVRELVK